MGTDPIQYFFLQKLPFFLFYGNIILGNIMSRKPRKTSLSNIYHIIMRGNNQQNLFCENSDRFFFLNRIEKYSKQVKSSIYAYCLMNNHVHILIGNVSKQQLSLFVQKLANSYVYYFNRKYECSGHLFQGRFKSEPIEDELYLKNVLRYILLNPEKACITKYNHYRWSSYPEIMNKTKNRIIDKNFVHSIFHSISEIERFISIPDESNYMEYENKIVYSDAKALLLIKKLFKIKNPYSLNKLDFENQLSKLHILKQHNLSINQISRLTGIKKHIIKIS